MSDLITIASHKGEYSVYFDKNGLNELNLNPPEDAFVIIDKNIINLYKDRLSDLLSNRAYLAIDATEAAKSLDKFQGYIEYMVDHQVRRGQTLIAIGGGIIQDITCFIATTMMRGLPWIFYPTTLLAQCDSCIGSKSSINVGKIKNILGTFTPPNEIVIDTTFLTTLEDKDIRSGIGEMLKVHAIDAPDTFNNIASNYDKIINDSTTMESFICQSLKIKKRIVELDEFDTGPRNVMNYGHSFGHAIESATNFAIPHGVAVTIGLDMANYIAAELRIGSQEHFERMHPVMSANYAAFKNTEIPFEPMLTALSKDKKNTSSQLRLILPDRCGNITIGLYDNDEVFKAACQNFFSQVFNN